MNEAVNERYGAPTPRLGVIEHAANLLRIATETEAQMRALLDRVRGSNVKHLTETPPEPMPTGLQAILDQLERRHKNIAELFSDLNEIF